MKKIFFFVILSFIYASNTVVLSKKTKETNSTIIETTTLIKKWLVDKYNAITPDFLTIQPKDRMIDFQIAYDVKTRQLKEKLNIRVLFPAFVKITKKINANTKTNKTKKNLFFQTEYRFKILPLIRIYKQKLTPILKTSLDLENDYLSKAINFNETFYFHFIFNEYKEITTITFNRFLFVDNLMFKFSKTYLSTQKSNLFYLFATYYYSDFIKYIKTYGFEMSGERKKLPFIYSYKLFFTYRRILFNKRYMFIDISPYLEANKKWNYKIKSFLNLSFNIRF